MSLPNTLQELTNKNQLYELRYDASGANSTGEYIENIVGLLIKCGVSAPSSHIQYVYDDVLEQAVKDYQTKARLPVTGILNNTTYQSMLYYDKKFNGITVDNSGNVISTPNVDKNPHFDPFFEADNFKDFRKNHQDIKIIIGDGSVVKTIKDVIIRSSTLEVDTSGNPIAEVYEFVARDIKESDEINDTIKYVGPESKASSDVQYIYNFNQKAE